MAKGTDEVKVGLFVVIAAVVLIITLVLVGRGQGFGHKSQKYLAKLKFAGGVEAGTVVRFAGIKAGRVADVQIDPDDSTQAILTLDITPETPLKTDSVATIQTLGFLGDYYVEISPGTKTAAALPAGSTLKTKEAVSMAQLFDQINSLSGDSKDLIANLNEKLNMISGRVDEVLTNVNSVLNEPNKRELAALLRNGNTLITHGDQLIDKEAPKLDATLTNVEKAAERITPMLDDARGTIVKLDGLIKNLDGTVADLHPELKTDLVELKKAETQTEALLMQMQELLRHNRSDIDEIIVNLAHSSRNVEDLTNTLKQRPYSILGIKPIKDRKVPGGK